MFYNIQDWFYNLYLKYIKRIINDDEKVIKLIINNMLKKYNVDYEFVTKNQIIEEKNWYEYYTFDSEEEYENWKKYSLKILKRRYYYGSDDFVKKQFVWIDLMWGLKQNYEIK